MKIHGLGGVTGERANGIDECSIPAERAAHGGTDGIDAAFVRLRLRLLHHLRELKEAHEQGLALDMTRSLNSSRRACAHRQRIFRPRRAIHGYANAWRTTRPRSSAYTLHTTNADIWNQWKEQA